MDANDVLYNILTRKEWPRCPRAMVETILFAFLNSKPVLDAKDVLYNIPTWREWQRCPQAMVATILFAFLNSISVLDAIDVLYNIPTRKRSEWTPSSWAPIMWGFLESKEILSIVMYKVEVVQMLRVNIRFPGPVLWYLTSDPLATLFISLIT